jgi:hypothetical protein
MTRAPFCFASLIQLLSRLKCPSFDSGYRVGERGFMQLRLQPFPQCRVRNAVLHNLHSRGIC